ncbi:RagB/SusD family nutrient uptake outer membrane protein [Niabella sp.]|uniref:RagB/SusD family nutrient uptake outer membrane protein n=1 Tax=Niabella sp. TaxID=1962976 RepID=UPI002617D66E|nr:RagB/SusD family nutrient uptake outer membrane protein [Niabella sp.]
MKIFFIYILLVAIFLLPSCKKFLDKKNDSSVLVPSSLDDLQELLDDADYMNLEQTPSYGESYATDFFLLPKSYDGLRTDWKKVYQWNPDDSYAPNDWQYAYFPIYNANYCLDEIGKIPVSETNKVEWNNIYGSAYFFKAYYYLNLLWIYAKGYDKNQSGSDLGIVLRASSDFNVPSVRSTVEECYQEVIADAMKAAKFLPNKSIHPYRPSKCAAYGLLARTYLSMNRYDSVLKYSALALSITDTLLNYNSAEVKPSSSVPFKPFNPEIIFFTTMNILIRCHATNIASVDTTLYSSYSENDLRKTIFFKASQGYQAYKGSYAASPSLFFTGIATDELVLMKAESLARLGKINESLGALNGLLVNRWNKTLVFIPLTANTSDEALAMILAERRKELLMRGLRWPDIKRLNKLNPDLTLKRTINGTAYVIAPNDNRSAIPLPKDIINQTGMPQNPN